MKAIVCSKYGPFDALKPVEIPTPVPGDKEVLVKIHASSVNFNNLIRINGKMLMARLMDAGLFKPKYKIPGNDVAGRVEAVGRNIKQFKPGDEVFGDLGACGHGAFAEYVCVPESALALKPANVSFEEAAGAAEAGVVALQGLRDLGHIKAGRKVLIAGASGGIGTFAVQIAKAFGAEVTGVCGTKNLDLVRSIGANHVIDYTKEDFTQNGQLYDLILATAGYRSIYDYRRALGPRGIYVVTGGSMHGPKAMAQIFEAMLKGPFLSKAGGRQFRLLTLRINQRDLAVVGELMQAGKVKTVIDRTYPLSKVGEALAYYEQGHARGKVAISVAH